METKHKVVITGRDRQIAFPKYCANCGSPAAGRLPVEKIFTRIGTIGGGGHDGVFKVVTSFKVFFCPLCIEQHKQEVTPLTGRNWVVAFLMGGMLVVPAAYIFFLSLNLWTEFFQAVRDVDYLIMVIYGVLAVLSLGVVTMLFIVARQLSRPYLVVPPTSITRAVDFSDRSGGRTFWFRHEGYTGRFREANRKRLWSPGQSRRGLPWRWFFRLILLGLVAAAIWWVLTLGA